MSNSHIRHHVIPAMVLVSSVLGFIGAAHALDPVIKVGSATAMAGQQVTVSVSLSTAGALVAGTQNDIAFDGTNVQIAALSNGKPDCVVNPGIDKGASSITFLPDGCSGAACSAIRALVFSIENSDPIPDGATLYTCAVNISSVAAPGLYPLTNQGVILSDPSGTQIPQVLALSGSIFVTEFSPTATPTSTSTPTWTPTPTPTPTNTTTPTSTSFPISSPTPSPTPVPCTGDCNGDGQVTVNELIEMVSCDLIGLPGLVCCDANGDGEITINEIIQAVGYALNGCPAT